MVPPILFSRLVSAFHIADSYHVFMYILTNNGKSLNHVNNRRKKHKK